jgi:hypothetical protein
MLNITLAQVRMLHRTTTVSVMLHRVETKKVPNLQAGKMPTITRLKVGGNSPAC